MTNSAALRFPDGAPLLAIGRAHTPPVVLPETAARPDEADPRTAALCRRCREALTIDPDLEPTHAATLRHSITRLLGSRTARARRPAFRAGGGPVLLTIARESTADGALVTSDACYVREDGSERVVIREGYLQEDAAFRDVILPSVLAHELLGHAVAHRRAARENLSSSIWHCAADEACARLIGWMVKLDLGGTATGDHGLRHWEANPEGYFHALLVGQPYYALTFSPDEMRDLTPVLKSRLTHARIARAACHRQRDNRQTWVAVTDHFVSQHGIDPARFRGLRAELDAGFRWLNRDLAVRDSAITTLERTLAQARAEPDAAGFLTLRAAADHPLFAAMLRAQHVLGHILRSRLARCRADEAPGRAATDAASGNGQIDFDTLYRMYLRDCSEHPAHWQDWASGAHASPDSKQVTARQSDRGEDACLGWSAGGA